MKGPWSGLEASKLKFSLLTSRNLSFSLCPITNICLKDFDILLDDMLLVVVHPDISPVSGPEGNLKKVTGEEEHIRAIFMYLR